MFGRLGAARLPVPPPGQARAPETSQPQLQLAVLTETDKPSLKCIRKCKGHRKPKQLPKERANLEDSHNVIPRLIYKATGIRMVWWCCLDSQMDSRNSTGVQKPTHA